MRRRTLADQWAIYQAQAWIDRDVDLRSIHATAAHLGTGHMIMRRLLDALERETNR